MQEHGIYFGKSTFFDLIRSIGGAWNDSKERPMVCLIKSKENENLYWAIPMGNLNHRDEKAKERINKYLNYDESDIRSCFYHIGNTDVTFLFFSVMQSLLQRTRSKENTKENIPERHM